MPLVLHGNLPCNLFARALKIRAFSRLQSHMNDGILPHVHQVRFACLHDVQPLKQSGVVNLFAIFAAHILKEILEHTQIQRLAKSPRSGEKIHRPFHIEQIPHEVCLIYKIIPARHKHFKIIHPDRKRFSVISHSLSPFYKLFFLSIPSFCIIRNL